MKVFNRWCRRHKHARFAGTGLAGWSTLIHRDVGLDVVEVAASGVDGAAGEDAVAVAEDDEVAHPLWWVVLVHGIGAAHVQHRLELDLADPLEPGLDQIERRSTALLHGPGRQVAGEGGAEIGEVDVQVDRRAGLAAAAAGAGAGAGGPGGQVGGTVALRRLGRGLGWALGSGDCSNRSRTSWGWARAPRARARRSSRGESSPRRPSWFAVSETASSRSWASSASRRAYTVADPATPSSSGR